METQKKNYFQSGGIQVDVSKFLNNPSDLLVCSNFRTDDFGAKSVRPGYATFLNVPSGSAGKPIRNLYYYNIPSGTGVFCVANQRLYKYTGSGTTWGNTPQTFSVDVVTAFATLSGNIPYVHFSNATDGLYSTDAAGNIYTWNGWFTPKASYLASWGSRLFGDLNRLLMYESAISFDLNGTLMVGTIAVTNGSKTVTGTGTTFTTSLTANASSLLISGVVYKVSAITNDTSLTLSANYAGSTASGLAFKTSYSADPFYLNANDPAGGGSSPVNSGADGRMVGFTASSDRIHIYKEQGVYRWNGQAFMRYPWKGNVLGICTTDNDIDYMFATTGIFKNDGRQIIPADFGINKIIKNTFKTYGITNPVCYSLDDLTYFYVGRMNASPSSKYPLIISNAMLVHNEKFDEWYIWSLAHQMTAFGRWLNPTTNRLQLISGDNNGNTYIWGDEYYNDNGTPISYHLRYSYLNMGDPDKTKILDKYSVSMENGQTSSLNFAIDYEDEYKNEDFFLPKLLSKDKSSIINDFKAISAEIMGTASNNRPIVYGVTISYKGGEADSDRSEDVKKSRR